MDYNFKEIFDFFLYEGEFVEANPYGEGHINETFLVETTKKTYILQRVNNTVFKKPQQVIDNIEAVTEFLREIIIKNGGNPDRETLTLIPTKDGNKCYIDEEGNLFRAYLNVDKTCCYQTVENPDVFYRVAKTFGRFQKLLADFPAEKLYETIPNFHNTVDRYRIFKETLAADKMGRAKEVQAEINFVLEREKDAALVLDAINSGEIPLRVTHNDTKLNNVLVDEKTGDGLCVIDLDTVMPGSMLYDFGDSIRFGASTAAEDETDLSKVSMDLNLFEAYTKGYIEELKDSFTKKELELLAFSAKLMTLECGTRFLTDYLDGDNYFKIHRENHNLDRARTQFTLVKDMEEKMDKMNEIVNKYYNA